MSIAYRTATGDLVALRPLPLTLRPDDGRVVGELGGRDDAPMATARAMRAAQTFFDLPTRGVDATLRGAETTIARDALGDVLERKHIAAFEDGDSQLLRLLYREIVLRFLPATSRKRRAAILRERGLEVRRTNPLIPDQVVAYDTGHARPAEELVEVALALGDLDEVAFATPNFVSQYLRRSPAAAGTPSTAQWHLRLVNASRAWRTTRGKRAVTIAILDDGVDVEHPELKGNIRRKPDPDEPRDLCGRDFFVAEEDVDHFNPRPKRFRAPFHVMAGNDIHGTPCAGVAAGTGPKGFGLGPNCRILPVKIFHADDLAADAQVADAIRYAALHADILSCSWAGPRSPDIEFALRDAVSLGRKGRGAIVVCAAGNDARARVGFPASDPNAIGVGASTDDDDLASYSNRGPEVHVVAPSSGGAQGIWTTDVGTPGRGFNTGQAGAGDAAGLFTNDFGGTSSATPLVAGLCALLLSVRATLSIDEVRRLLATGAKKIGPASAYDANGHSHRFGFGRIDAAATLTALAALQKAAATTAKKTAKKAAKKR
jgi:subtilisin family serine protease